jgi:predicted TIM-barrel fold metal-dependent hydrolase
MTLQRREFLAGAAAGVTCAALGASAVAEDAKPLIVDTHQHLWDLTKLKLPWHADAPDILKKTYHLKEYAEATKGLNVKTVYMEVDVDRSQLIDEAEHVIALSKLGMPMVGAVIGGSPESPEFAKYIDRFKGVKEVKGVRRVLHAPDTPAGFCLEKQFVKNVQLLGERGLRFDLCMRPSELLDGVKLSEQCPDTQFTLDHCGNADPTAFRGEVDGKQPWHTVEQWKKGIDALAKRKNVICKISGIIARLPKGQGADELAPIVNDCLDAFGPDRVVFGSDWPVCLLGGTLQQWTDMLTKIIASRKAAERTKLWSGNAVKQYALTV